MPDEEKVLRAARETGAAITIPRPWPRGEKLCILDILASEGADLMRVIMDQVDLELDLELHQAIADQGVYLEYDTCAPEFYHEAFNFHDPLDIKQVAVIAEMVRWGYVSQILLSQDICTKMETCRYSGWGYAHISQRVEPMLETTGVTPKQIQIMRVDNPRASYHSEGRADTEIMQPTQDEYMSNMLEFCDSEG